MKDTYYSPESHLQISRNRIVQQKRQKRTGSQAKNRIKITASEQGVFKIGNYMFDKGRQLGNGYSSHVYLGYNIKQKTKCAVKVIDLKNYSESSKIMLSNEIQILKKIKHPNVLKFYDSYRTSTNCYIITEVCQNGNLQEYLLKRGKIKQEVAVSIMDDIIKGLKYLFSLGIIHRDLKPANIFNDAQQWKIGDFGFAILTQNGVLTSKQNVGTPLYMPLQALCYNKYSFQSDIFSVGIIFYELIIGITPWQSKTQKQLIKKMKQIPYSIQDSTHVSVNIRKIIQKMVALSLSQRMTAQQFRFLNLVDKIQNDEIYNEHLKLKSYLSNIQTESPSKIKSIYLNPRTEAINNHRLITQLNVCRFIYYFIKNSNNLRVNTKNLMKIKYILYIHIVRITANMIHKQHNWFHLFQWQQYRISQKFNQNLISFQKYHIKYVKQKNKYQQQLDQQIKNKVISSIQELQYPGFITSTFYQSIIQLITPIIRQANHNIGRLIQTDQLSKQSTTQIQTLKNLIKYYEICKIMQAGIEGYSELQKRIDIKVNIDYSKNNNSISTIQELRQAIINI